MLLCCPLIICGLPEFVLFGLNKYIFFNYLNHFWNLFNFPWTKLWLCYDLKTLVQKYIICRFAVLLTRWNASQDKSQLKWRIGFSKCFLHQVSFPRHQWLGLGRAVYYFQKRQRISFLAPLITWMFNFWFAAILTSNNAIKYFHIFFNLLRIKLNKHAFGDSHWTFPLEIAPKHARSKVT